MRLAIGGPNPWHTTPRDAVASAAAAGDIDAQTAMRIHRSLDQIERSVLYQTPYDTLEASVHEIVNAIRQAINDDPRYDGM